jgi:hypothetical protein
VFSSSNVHALAYVYLEGRQRCTVEELMRKALLFVIVVAMVATGLSWAGCFSKAKPTSCTLSVAAG